MEYLSYLTVQHYLSHKIEQFFVDPGYDTTLLLLLSSLARLSKNNCLFKKKKSKQPSSANKGDLKEQGKLVSPKNMLDPIFKCYYHC